MTEREEALKALLKMVDAYHGSLDAAKAMHDAVLPGWRVSVSQEMEISGSTTNFLTFVAPMDATKREHVFRPYGQHRLPARAWLIAIIKALIAQGREDGEGK